MTEDVQISGFFSTPRRVETKELIITLRNVGKEYRKLYRQETALHLYLAAAELERLSYPLGCTCSLDKTVQATPGCPIHTQRT